MFTAQRARTLTPRDLAILEMVYEYGGLITRHIRRRFFATTGGRTPCYRRLSRLINDGHLVAVRHPSHTGVGSGPVFLSVGRAGWSHLATAFGILPSELRGVGHGFAPLFLAHHSAICDTRLSVELASSSSGNVQLMEWIPERELKRTPIRRTDPKSGRSMPIVPDGALTLSFGDGRELTMYLEQDMGTIAKRRMGTKLRLYLAQEEKERRAPIVLVVTTTQARQAAICRWAVEEASWLTEQTDKAADPTRFLVTTAAELSEETVFAAPIWRVAGGPERFSLVTPENASNRAAERRLQGGRTHA